MGSFMIQNMVGHQTMYMQIKQPQFNLFHDCGNQNLVINVRIW
jgi:hypothetical protein